MKKYRIKTITFKNGRQEFVAQFKGVRWKYLSHVGEEVCYSCPSDTREDALNRIELHYAGNNEKESTDVEYIEKP